MGALAGPALCPQTLAALRAGEMRWIQMLSGVHLWSGKAGLAHGAMSETPGLCPVPELDGELKDRLGEL